MSTAAQILANRQNAGKSTGPKTPEGKNASSRNAVRHGLAGRFYLLPNESQDEFDALAERLAAEHAPEGDTETFLVDQMIQSRWKLIRLERLEALAMEQILTHPSAPPDADTAVLESLSRNGAILDKLARYQAAAERAYFKALRELRAVRLSTRRAEARAMEAYVQALVHAPLPGSSRPVQNEANPAPRNAPASASPKAPPPFQRPTLTPEELAHPALRL